MTDFEIMFIDRDNFRDKLFSMTQQIRTFNIYIQFSIKNVVLSLKTVVTTDM